MKFIRKTTLLLLVMVLTVGALTVSASAAETQMYGIGFVDASNLRLRSEANTTSATLAMAPRNDCVVVISKEGQWYRVNYNLQEGYMHESYLDVLTRENAELGYGKIQGTRVNMRSGPSTSYGTICVTDDGNKGYILGLNDGWYKVIYNNSIGYIRSDFVSLTEIPYENADSPNTPKFYRLGKSTGVVPSAAALSDNSSGNQSSSSGNQSSSSGNSTSGSSAPSVKPNVSATGADILEEAEKYLGTPYVYGGASPSGFDCSGFVYYVLKQVGYAPYRTPNDQYKHGTYVDKSDLQVGDIVFFSNTYASGLSHVGIYAGNGQFIHSPNSRSTVSYSDLTSGYWAEHYHGARRMG